MPRAARHPVVPRHLAVERPVDGASAADTRAAFRDAEASPDGPAATEADEARRSAFPDVEVMGRQAVDPLDVQMRQARQVAVPPDDSDSRSVPEKQAMVLASAA